MAEKKNAPQDAASSEKEKKLLVTTPNKAFNGERLGVVFKDGKGYADAETARILVQEYGYSCKALSGKGSKKDE